jgi:bifunctional enzyme CysN/CysC
LANFTGIDSAYEAPETPDLRLPGAVDSADTLAGRVIELMHRRGLLSV